MSSPKIENNDIQFVGPINCDIKFDSLGRRYPATRRSKYFFSFKHVLKYLFVLKNCSIKIFNQ